METLLLENQGIHVVSKSNNNTKIQNKINRSLNNVKLECVKLSKVYPTQEGPYVVLEDLNLKVYNEEFVSIIGHSGCGKSTVLTMIAGLNGITRGNISIDKNSITGPGPDRAVVFQSPSLMPWMTAIENVSLGVDRVFPHISKKERADICKYYLDVVGLGDSFYKKARDLSNGMKQRVGIARAFALKPEVLLLDEPFGMLDSLTRAELQEVLIHVWREEKITAIMVTHDVDEAIYLSDRVVMMTSGPYATISDTLHIDFSRPRNRQEIFDIDEYYLYRQYLIDFLHH